MRSDARGIVLSVPGDVLFEFDNAKLQPEARRALELAKIFLADHQKSDILIEGHTDGVGSAEYNLDLSLERAKNVASWLIDLGGIPDDKIRAVGLGEERPVAPEIGPKGADDPTARQLNRRVEIRILK